MPARRPTLRATPTRRRARTTAASVVRITEATGESPRSWEAAITAAVKAADVKDPVGVEVARMWADWKDGRLGTYRASVKVAYRQTLRPPKP